VLAEMAGNEPSQGVVAAAGRVADDEVDRFAGVKLLVSLRRGRDGQAGQCSGQDSDGPCTSKNLHVVPFHSSCPGRSASLRTFTPVFDGLWTRVNALMTRASIEKKHFSSIGWIAGSSAAMTQAGPRPDLAFTSLHRSRGKCRAPPHRRRSPCSGAPRLCSSARRRRALRARDRAE